jgi:hypothetical protein
MIEPWLIVPIVALAIAGGAFLDRVLQWFSFLRRPPEPSKQLRDRAKEISDWLASGRAQNVLDQNLAVDTSNLDALKSWFRYVPSMTFVEGETLCEDQRSRLEARFWLVFSYIVLLGVVSASVVLKESSSKTPPSILTICVAASLFGSCVAAFRSCLDRRANGFEDKYGNTSPDPSQSKERFGDGMFSWFIGRPILGAAVGVLAYLGLTGQILSEGMASTLTVGPPTRLAFFTALAGLFAKTLLDLLLEVTKKIFRV